VAVVQQRGQPPGRANRRALAPLGRILPAPELITAETSQPAEQADGLPDGERLPDPDAQRYEVGLRGLLGAVEVLEDRPDPEGR